MAFLRRRPGKEKAALKTSTLPAVERVANLPRLRVGGLRLDALNCVFIQVECDCGHVGEVPVAPLQQRYGRASRVRDALGAIRCSRCGAQTIRRVYAHR